MQRQPTVLLLHETRTGSHFDWLIGDPRHPGDPQSRLWTARTTLPSRHWAAARQWDLLPLPPHRRHYLTYQGPLSGQRGYVRRIDRGWVVPLRWTATCIELQLHMRHCRGRVRLQRLSDSRWRACLQESHESGV